MKHSAKALWLVLALILLLTMLPVTALAEAHVHTYHTSSSPTYTYSNNQQHYKYGRTKYVCSCGDTYYVNGSTTIEAHTAAPGSQKLISTTIGADGKTEYLYQYTCKFCNHTYTRRS